MTILAPIRQHIEALAAAPGYPAQAVEACLQRSAEAAPLLRALLQRAARGQALSEAEADQLFLGVHILARLRDEQSYLPLMRLLGRPFAEIDGLLGDAVGETLHKVVASVFDGDANTLFDLIGDARVDEIVREALWRAAIALTFAGRIERARMSGEIQRFGDERLAPKGDMAWVGWLGAIAMLGFDDLAAANSVAWIDQRLPADVITRAEFDRDLAAAMRAPDDAARLAEVGIGTVDDVADTLGWVPWDGPPQPVFNPMRHVGRNDPCPCGSGRKAKKCCLAA